VRARLFAIAIAIAAVFSTAVGPVADSVAASQGEGGRRDPWLDLAGTLSAIVPRPLIDLFGGGGQAISTGSDGRLTILLLGADSRTGQVGRTDTIMLFSVKGNSISIASIPRDTARIPNPSGGTYSARVNALFRQLGANEFMRVLEHTLGIEIDHYALVTFFGFHALVDEYDPVTINTRQVRDTQYWDDPEKPKGVYFPAQQGYELYAWQPNEPSQLCNGLWQTQGTGQQNWCRRAMPYVRSRKGSSDFARASRQQDFVMASIRRVLNRGLGGLVGTANQMESAGQLRTDIPVNASNAQDLFNRLNGAGVAVQEVLSPPRFSKHIPGGTGYELDLTEVRAFMRQNFGGSGTPPPPTQQPTPTTGPTNPPGATPTPTPFRTPSPAPTLPPGVTPSPAPTLPPGVTPSPAPTLPPGVTPSPAPTLPPGVSPSPSPSLAPGQTPLPTPTLAPGQTPLPTPTLAPGQTPLPTPSLAPGQTPVPTTVAGVPSAEPGSGDPNAPPTGGAVAPTPGTGAPADPTAQTGDSNVLIAVAVLGALVAAAAVFIGWRRIRPRATP
jgi:anionic cell wall polymer biosynthesis LytR-Cps2A-Psr (LCP) family protein